MFSGNRYERLPNDDGESGIANGSAVSGSKRSGYGSVSSEDRRSSVEGEGDGPETPLIQDDVANPVTVISMPMNPALTDSIDIPDEPIKTLLAGLFLGFGFLFTSFSLALTHELVPETDPLPDLVLDHVPYQTWGVDVSEYIIVLMILSGVILVIFHHHRMVILRRIFLILGMMYIYRGITMYITVLPKSNPEFQCAPKLNHTITFVELIKRVVQIAAGGGLTINGVEMYCGDFIFSGHTMVLLMAYFVIREYAPPKVYMIHWLYLCLTLVGIICLMLGRGHYSIDVIVAYWVTSRLWWMYHTMAHTPALKMKGDHNFVSNMWWWYGFRHFEVNVQSPLPKRYSVPLPASVKTWAVRKWQERTIFRRRSAARDA